MKPDPHLESSGIRGFQGARRELRKAVRDVVEVVVGQTGRGVVFGEFKSLLFAIEPKTGAEKSPSGVKFGLRHAISNGRH